MKRKVWGLLVVVFVFFTVLNIDVKAAVIDNTDTVNNVIDKRYAIKYELYGGVNYKGNPKSYTKNTATIKLGSPTRKGYTFKGWYSNAKLTKKVTAIKKGSTGNKTLYAKWIANSYTVNFNGNGATSGKMSSLTNRKYGVAYNLPTNTFKKKGYTFGGWTTKKNGTGTVFKKSFKNLTSKNKGVVTFYAKWISNTYTVKFNGNGATSGTMNSLANRKYGVTYKLPNNTFKKNGYVFAGWTINKNGESKVYTNGNSIKNLTSKNKGTITLYAQWKLKAPTLKSIENTRYDMMSIQMNKVKNADGYEYYYSRSKNGKYTYLSGAYTNVVVVSDLNKAGTYYFKVRAYKVVNGKKKYSDFSKVFYKKTADKPVFNGKVIKKNGNQSTIKLYINNQGDKQIIIDEAPIMVYPDANINTKFTKAIATNKVIKPHDDGYITLKLDSPRKFSNGTTVGYYFIYDKCVYISVLDDYGNYLYM